MDKIPNQAKDPVESLFDSSLEVLGQEDTQAYSDMLLGADQEERQEILHTWMDEVHETREYQNQMMQTEAYLKAFNQTNSRYEQSMGRIAILMAGEKDSEKVRQIELDTSKIGWLNDSESVVVDAELCEYHDQKFWVANLTGHQNATKDAFEKLESQGLAEKLMDSIKGATGAAFIEDLRKGAGTLRPMSKGSGPNKRDKKIDTEYPCYKIGVQGSNNRALLILPEKIDGQQVLVVAALFDHEDDQKVYNALNA